MQTILFLLSNHSEKLRLKRKPATVQNFFGAEVNFVQLL